MVYKGSHMKSRTTVPQMEGTAGAWALEQKQTWRTWGRKGRLSIAGAHTRRKWRQVRQEKGFYREFELYPRGPEKPLEGFSAEEWYKTIHISDFKEYFVGVLKHGTSYRNSQALPETMY